MNININEFSKEEIKQILKEIYVIEGTNKIIDFNGGRF